MTSTTRKRVLSPHSIFDEPRLRELFAEHSVNTHHINSIYRTMQESFDAIPELPVRILPLLKANFVFSTSTIASRKDASDNSTTKLVIELQDGQQVETVIMRYGERERRIKELEKEGKQFKSNKRATVCISSQVGCAMGCTFCGMNFHANKIEKIRNVVFMGMGEPLDNYDAVLGAIQAMINTGRFCLSPSRITVSTVGVAPRITSLMKDVPQIGLALSLHAPTQELRQEIVPSSKSFSLTKILQAVFAFIENQNKLTNSNVRHILVEYVLIQDINSSAEVAHQLGQLFADRVAKKDILVNIIPYNPTDVIANYQRPTAETLKTFVEIVRSYGVYTLIRQELGQDIASACGQLVVKGPKKDCSKETEAADLEDLVGKKGNGKKSTPAVVKRARKEAPVVTEEAAPSSSLWVIGGIALGLGLLALAAARTLRKK
ncbi:hypothetical protein BDR26DRAFT_858344 [Obelidium mucronatum]|nr:hypothetical protein BDR26DRAFT_858344 [Obelidium mucronatum]